MEFTDKKVVITAAGAGIGRALALGFSARGAAVWVSDLDGAKAQETADLVVARGGVAGASACDVSQDADVEAMKVAVLDRFGRVDVLVNHAGVAAAGWVTAIPVEDWRWVFEVNILGPIRAIKAFLPGMLERRSGWIVNTASNLGLFPEVPMALPYITTKSGLIGLSRALSLALRPQGVGVSVLCPDITETAFHYTGRMHGFTAEQAAAGLPLNRQQPPESVAEALFKALAQERFLATNMPDVQSHLLKAAQSELEPEFQVYPELAAIFARRAGGAA